MVEVCIITGFGINADRELLTAFEAAGSHASRIHISDIIEDPHIVESYDILAFPGGFSFGDHLGSGKVFANLCRVNLKSQIESFIDRGKLIIGICNGFQVLVKMGILPNLSGNWTKEVSLVRNESGKFEDRWVNISFNPSSRCVWTEGLTGMELPVRHGEGRFVVKSESVLTLLKRERLIALRYATRVIPEGTAEKQMSMHDNKALKYPDNPNGSIDNIAGICDRTGRVFGLMPHPEAFLIPENHPRWPRYRINGKSIDSSGLSILKKGVEYIERMS